MNDHVLKTIEQIQAEILKAEEALRPRKQMVNGLLEMIGQPPAYDLGSAGVGRPAVKRNAFYGRPLATCVREFLESRESAPVREATLEQIFDALKEGGYDVKAHTETGREEDARRAVAITLGKNSQTFHRLPTGDYGLLAWYPAIRERKIIGKNGEGKDAAPAGETPAQTSPPADKAPE